MSNLNPNQFGGGPPSARDRLRAAPPLSGSLANVRDHFEALRAASQPIGAREAAVGAVPVSEEKPGFYRKRYDTFGRDDTHYEYHVPKGESYDRTHLQMIVHHSRPSAHYSTAEDVAIGGEEPTPSQAEHMLRSHSWLPTSRRDVLQGIAEGKPKLFGSSHTPGSSEVFSLFGTKRGRAHAGTMLGIAAKDTAERYGRTLTPPDDLSPHSARLVENLKGKGVVSEQASSEAVNAYDFYTDPEWTSLRPEDRIPDDEVAAGRSTMRSVLRQGRPRKPRETYVQDPLF